MLPQATGAKTARGPEAVQNGASHDRVRRHVPPPDYLLRHWLLKDQVAKLEGLNIGELDAMSCA